MLTDIELSSERSAYQHNDGDRETISPVRVMWGKDSHRLYAAAARHLPPLQPEIAVMLSLSRRIEVASCHMLTPLPQSHRSKSSEGILVGHRTKLDGIAGYPGGKPVDFAPVPISVRTPDVIPKIDKHARAAVRRRPEYELQELSGIEILPTRAQRLGERLYTRKSGLLPWASADSEVCATKQPIGTRISVRLGEFGLLSYTAAELRQEESGTLGLQGVELVEQVLWRADS